MDVGLSLSDTYLTISILSFVYGKNSGWKS